MNLKFSKSYLSTYESDDHVRYKGLRLYYVYKDNSLLGQYFRHGNKQFYKFQDKQVRIESTEKWYKKPHFKIIDEHDNQVMGEFVLPQYYNSSIGHYPEVPYSNPYLKIILFNTEYDFRRHARVTKYRLFNRSTWGHYSFGLYNKQDECVVNYTFKIEKPMLDGEIMPDNNLEGHVSFDEDQYDLLFAGFFLLEKFFDDQNRSG